jgi:hypothetical protein
MHNLVDCAAGGDPVVRSNNWFEKRDLQFFDRLAVTRLTRVLSANGQNPIGADKDATVRVDVELTASGRRHPIRHVTTLTIPLRVERRS